MAYRAAMSDIFYGALAVALNVLFYFALQLLSAFVTFALFGSGQGSVRPGEGVELFFVLLQAAVLLVLYRKKFFIKSHLSLALQVFLVLMVYSTIKGYYLLHPNGSLF